MCGKRQISYPQGYGLGGTSNINATIFCLGSRIIFDKYWPQPMWSSTNVNKWMQTVCSIIAPQPTKAAHGPIQNLLSYNRNISNNIKEVIWAQPTANTFMTVSESAGAGTSQTMGNKNKRIRTLLGKKCLADVSSTTSTHHRSCGRLILQCNTQVEKIIFESQPQSNTKPRVVAVQAVPTGSTQEQLQRQNHKATKLFPENDGEVILCAGAINTPTLLAQSGLKGKGTNTKNDTESVQLPNLEAIGSNLQDHTMLPLLAVGFWGGGLPAWLNKSDNENIINNNDESGEADLCVNHPINGVHGWIYLDSEGTPLNSTINAKCDKEKEPTIQLVFVDGRCAAGILPNSLLPSYPIDSSTSTLCRMYVIVLRPILHYILSIVCDLTFIKFILRYFVFGFVVCLVNPASRGQVVFQQIDKPSQTLLPELDLRYFSSSKDIQSMFNGMNTARKIMTAGTINININTNKNSNNEPGLKYIEVIPGPLFGYSATIESFISYARLFLGTYYHISGTCAMGNGCETNNGTETGTGSSVVDDKLCVHGVSNLRIADASVFPHIPTAPTSATAMVVGVAASEFILKNFLE
jgi:choline dehydrogenase-like flavoprotein